MRAKFRLTGKDSSRCLTVKEVISCSVESGISVGEGPYVNEFVPCNVVRFVTADNVDIYVFISDKAEGEAIVHGILDSGRTDVSNYVDVIDMSTEPNPSKRVHDLAYKYGVTTTGNSTMYDTLNGMFK